MRAKLPMALLLLPVVLSLAQSRLLSERQSEVQSPKSDSRKLAPTRSRRESFNLQPSTFNQHPHALTVEQGRHYWAFQPLRRAPLPAVKDAAWCRTPIDRFILAGLEAKGLRPNPPADRRTLIRRAYFDLIGLPPSPAEVEAFVSDPSPDAYPRLVDRLLASPHYGERWGRHWLDLARFAESHGYEQDYDRPSAYQYRDFVIKALNQDMPYDQFVRWQLAGDEIAPEEPLALMATGFLAAGTHATQITKNQVEKERYDELDDMLATTGTAMLGLTLGCARCHDHKYDPVPRKDYYRMLSTFTTTVRSDYDVNMDPAGYKRAMAAFQQEHAPLLEARSRFEREQLPVRLDRWLKERSPQPDGWILPEQVSARSDGEATFTPLEDGSLLVSGKNPDTDIYTITVRTRLTGIMAIRLEALADPSMVKGGPGRASNGNFALSDVQVKAAPLGPTADPVPVKLVRAAADFEQKGLPASAAIDGDQKSAWAIDPQFGRDHGIVFDLEQPLGFPQGTQLTLVLKFENNTRHGIGRPRISLQAAPPLHPFTPSPLHVPLTEAAYRALHSGAAMTAEERQALLLWYRNLDPDWQRLNRAVYDHLAKAPKPRLEKALIASEGVPAVRTHTQGGDFLPVTHFLRRGDPNQKEGVATQAFLQVLSRAPESRWQEKPPPGWRTSYQRRGLANWITDTKDGAGMLLARVIVNRLWQHHIGRGIVATPSDFGTQGERPTHPELLDWLAVELTEPGCLAQRRKDCKGENSASGLTTHDSRLTTCWSLKRIHRLIMLSATYMQSAAVNPKAAKVDPDNRLCWRHPRQRLEAEAIRDAMLAVSGELDPTMFGPGTLDERMKRRSIYFFVKRSKLIPSMVLFDAPNALVGIGSRPVTTVAPQALMLLNSPQAREYAHSFARRVRPIASVPLPAAMDSAFLIALSRRPTARERAESLAFLAQQTASYRASGAQDPEPAALTDFCQALLGLNEFVYVD